MRIVESVMVLVQSRPGELVRGAIPVLCLGVLLVALAGKRMGMYAPAAEPVGCDQPNASCSTSQTVAASPVAGQLVAVIGVPRWSASRK
jgi:hypothetical protein